jgi:DNA-directed RNA polymerase subunit A'
VTKWPQKKITEEKQEEPMEAETAESEVTEEVTEEKKEEATEESSEEKSDDDTEEDSTATQESESDSKEPFDKIEGYQQFVHKKVDSILFGMLSPKMVKQMSSAKIVTPELYDKEGYPVDGGLMDIRLGVIDPGLKCKTCGYKLKECPGHFGYIELARPVLHINYVEVILNILRSTCRECGRVLIPEKKIDFYKEEIKRVEKEVGTQAIPKYIKQIIATLKTQNKCPHCKARQQKVMIEKPTTILENEKRVNPIEIRTRLEKLTDEDAELFGLDPKFARPEWMVLTILPIPPVTMRPSITLESGERSEDDLTHKLGDIVRINQRLFENINAGAPEIIIEDLWDLLQYHITTYFDNSVSQLPPARHRSGQPLKTIAERIKSKEGRIRHNLAGKRTNFSARTVISPDPALGINEVGVPMNIAMKLTVPELVNEWNAAYLKRFVEKGPKNTLVRTT